MPEQAESRVRQLARSVPINEHTYVGLALGLWKRLED
jgi:hypothetical protein